MSTTQLTIPGTEKTKKSFQYKGKTFGAKFNPSFKLKFDEEGNFELNGKAKGKSELEGKNIILIIEQGGIAFKTEVPLVILEKKAE